MKVEDSTLFDYSQVLVNHEPQLVANLDRFKALCGKKTKYGTFIASKQGQSLAQSLSASKDKKKPLDQSTLNHLKPFADNIQEQWKILDYVAKWCQVCDFQIRALADKGMEWDLQWNQILTLNCCQIFVTYTKACVFMATNPVVKFVTLIVGRVPEWQQASPLRPFAETQAFILEAVRSPFGYMGTQMKNMKDKDDFERGTNDDSDLWNVADFAVAGFFDI